MIEWERIERWQYVVDSVSSEYKKKFPDIDIEDIQQTLYQWFVEHPNKLNEWEAIGNKDAKNLIYRSLRNQALDYCHKWKAKSGGYEVSDLFFYEPYIVEELLKSMMRGGMGIVSSGKLSLAGGGGGGAPSEGGNVMAMMIEIDYAYWKLSKEDRKIIFMRNSEGFEFDDIAKEFELGSDDAARMRYNRSIKKLINHIGGFKPYKDYDSEPSSENSDSAGSDQSPSG